MHSVTQKGKYIFCEINAALIDRVERVVNTLLNLKDLILNLYNLNKHSFHFLFQNYFELPLYWVPSFFSSQNQSFPYYVFLSCAYFFLCCILLKTQCMQTVITPRSMFVLVDKCTMIFQGTEPLLPFSVVMYVMYICLCVYKMVVFCYLSLLLYTYERIIIYILLSYKLIFNSFPQKLVLSASCPVT